MRYTCTRVWTVRLDPTVSSRPYDGFSAASKSAGLFDCEHMLFNASNAIKPCMTAYCNCHNTYDSDISGKLI